MIMLLNSYLYSPCFAVTSISASKKYCKVPQLENGLQKYKKPGMCWGRLVTILPQIQGWSHGPS